MKHYPVEQGSNIWQRLHMGIPSASKIGRIITPKTGEYSKSARAYAFRLVGERLLNESSESFNASEWMQRGKELEPEAARFYALDQRCELAPAGFGMLDDGSFGASPDRLVGSDGLLELKCPAFWTHLEYMVDGFETDYRDQALCQMWVYERVWNDRMSYHPQMPHRIDRIERDDRRIMQIAKALERFKEEMHEIYEQAITKGLFIASEHTLTPTDAAYLRD
jgi:hypothetical protein